MTFGDPIVFHCPCCNKAMKMRTYRSYTSRGGELYSDGMRTGGPHFTPDLAKCPYCGAVFFRHNIWAKKEMSMSDAYHFKDVEDPGREDFINALEKKLAKNQEEEKQLREYLWRDLNNITRSGTGKLSENLLILWNENCKELLILTEKSLEQILKKKNRKNYNDSDREKSLITIAELKRNLGEFDKCVEIINSLSGSFDWLKNQFKWECDAKNASTFELLSKNEMELENFKGAKGRDYYERARILARRKHYQKALSDFKNAEDLGYKDINLFLERGSIYESVFKDYEKAMEDFAKALEAAVSDSEKSSALYRRGKLHKIKGDLIPALNDLNQALPLNDTWSALYKERKEIYQTLGNAEEAQWDAFKEKLVSDREFQKEIQKETHTHFIPLKERIYADRNKPIREIIGKEDWTTLVCVLIAQEDYEGLERYVKEGLPLNGIVPSYFMEFQPTPFYYATTGQMRGLLKEPRKMLKWLAENGADPNMPARDKTTPLGNQCVIGGNLDFIKYILEAGADPNAEFLQEYDYIKPLQLTVCLDYENDPSIDKKKVLENFSQDDIEYLKKAARILREYGAVI